MLIINQNMIEKIRFVLLVFLIDSGRKIIYRIMNLKDPISFDITEFTVIVGKQFQVSTQTNKKKIFAIPVNFLKCYT